MTKVAEEFGVSGSYLTRVCEALYVPRPMPGYWAKLAVGKAPPRTPLPEARPGDQLDWIKDGELRAPPPPRPTLPRTKPKRVHIPKDHIHGLIRGAKGLFENSRPVDEGAYLRPYKKLLVDVTSSKACLDHALAFANELFNAFEAAGHRVVLAPAGHHLHRAAIDEREQPSNPRGSYFRSNHWSPHRPTIVYVGTLAVGLSVIEMSEEVMLRYVGGKYIREADYVPSKHNRHRLAHTWTTTEELPCGRLRLTAYAPDWRVDWSMSWQETKQGSLRTAFKSIVKSIEDAAGDLISKLEEADRQAEIERQKVQEAEERRRREQDRRCIEESVQESRAHLEQIIRQWSCVVSVQQFLAGVERHAAALPETDQVQVLERLKLARDFLGNPDPLEFFLSWKTPTERYRSLYADE